MPPPLEHNPYIDIRFCGAGPPTKKQSVFDIPISTENRPCKKTIKNAKKQSVFDKNNQVLNIRICSPAAPDKNNQISTFGVSRPPRTKNYLFLTSRFRPKTAPAKKQSKTLKNNLFLIKTIRFWTFGFAAPGRPTENNQILTFGRSSGGGRAEKTIWLG